MTTTFDTGAFFSGGAGMFIQYHDIVKPVYMYAVLKMFFNENVYGLPINIIKKLPIISFLEWYIKRRYQNPIRCLDYLHQSNPDVLDRILQNILANDDSLYELSPKLNVDKMFYVYRKQHMSFPVYVYSEYEEPHIKKDCTDIFAGIDCKYLYGDLSDAIKKCDENFTYIFSDIELAKKASEILVGTCSHILIPREYRYNYIDNCKTFRYDLMNLSREHPFVRIGTTLAIDFKEVAMSFKKINGYGGRN